MNPHILCMFVNSFLPEAAHIMMLLHSQRCFMSFYSVIFIHHSKDIKRISLYTRCVFPLRFILYIAEGIGHSNYHIPFIYSGQHLQVC